MITMELIISIEVRRKLADKEPPVDVSEIKVFREQACCSKIRERSTKPNRRRCGLLQRLTNGAD